ncbi:serine protease [Pseudomonadota bacterium]
MGYPLDTHKLTIHQGIISSIYESGIAKVLQIDAPINKGHSGGPLFNEKGKVIGIITRKLNGLTKTFEKLRESTKSNIELFNEKPNGISFPGLDIIDALKINQKQILYLIDEIERSANVGIGHAFSIDRVKEEIENLNSSEV